MLTFVHCFESCNQESYTVLVVIDDVLSQLKSIMPDITSVYLRQNNAGVTILHQLYCLTTKLQERIVSS